MSLIDITDLMRILRKKALLADVNNTSQVAPYIVSFGFWYVQTFNLWLSFLFTVYTKS